MAWVILKEGEDIADDELRDYCRGRIAHYKVPRYWKVTDGFPMTITGKIQKFKMREAAVEELGLQSAAAVRTA
jgi:fatty-acyl-CoA synthase